MSRSGLLLLTLLVFLAGCKASTTTASNPEYLEQYTSGRYNESYTAASAAAGNLSGQRREHAALTAGLSAHAMDHNADAQHWLMPLAQSSDPKVAGQANATLGLIAQDQKRHSSAAAYLTTASEQLSGPDAARAAVYAGDSHRALKNQRQADEMYARARSLGGSDADVQRLLAARSSGGSGAGARAAGPSGGVAAPAAVVGAPTSQPFTISVGAFSARARADDVARQWRPKTSAQAMAAPRVVSVRSPSGSMLYAVRIGRFWTKAEAERMAAKLGTTARVTLATGE